MMVVPALTAMLAVALPGLAAATCETAKCPAAAFGAAVEALRLQIAGECACDPDEARTRLPYVQCVKGITREARKNGTLSGACAKAVRRCALASTCGRPGAVVCCKRMAGTGKARIAGSIRDCPQRGVACTAHTSAAGACEQSGQCVTLPCPSAGPGVPNAITFTVSATGSDFDRGWKGAFHNRTFPGGTRLTMCLSDCDAETDAECEGTGPTGSGSVNGATFGPPLPLVAYSVPVCLVSRFAEDFTGTVDLESGRASAVVKLVTEAYVTGDIGEVCPRCRSNGGVGSPGVCSSTGKPCTVESEVILRPLGPNPDVYTLSSECVPSREVSSGALSVELPLTTGEARLEGPTPCAGDGGLTPADDDCGEGSCTGVCSETRCAATDDLGRCVDEEGGIAQHCCSNDTNLKPCFPSAPDSGGAIVRAGSAAVPQPAWPDPTYPKMASGTVLAAAFCLDAAESSQVNLVTGLPGPGALLLPVTSVLTAGE